MDIADALQTTIELARQNIADQLDHPDKHKEQTEAVDMVEDLAVNQYGDDNIEAEDTPLEQRRDHSIKGTLTLSGTIFSVGTYKHAQGDSLFIHTNKQSKPIYFNTTKADLLIAALNASKAQIRED
jgi:hypothetical protein